MENYLKLNLLLNRVTKLIIGKFKGKWYDNYLSKWEDRPEFGKRLYLILERSQFFSELNYAQKQIIKKGETDSWDITLLYKIFSLNEFKEKTLFEEIKLIKNVRNNLYHNPNLEITDNDFKSSFDLLLQKLELFGLNQNEIKQIEANVLNTKIGYGEIAQNMDAPIDRTHKIEEFEEKKIKQNLILIKRILIKR